MNHKSHTLSLLLVSLFFFQIHAGSAQQLVFDDDPNRFIPSREIDVTHLTASIRIKPEKREVKGTATFHFNQISHQTDTLSVYVPDFQLENVTLDDQAADWKLIGDHLIVRLPSGSDGHNEHSLSITYTAYPQTELYFNGWDDSTHTLRKQIWAHRPSRWLPFIHDRLTTDLYVTFDSKYKVFSNGLRESVTTNPDGASTWHYAMHREHPFFSPALVIGDYDYQSSVTPGGLPIELWYYPDQKNHLDPTYQLMHQMIDFLENELSFRYPYELYRQAPVINYLYGAMETTTSTVFGDYMFIDQRAYWERNYINVNAHELTHQWFGNYISHLRHKDVWLTESFATYYAKLFEKTVFGEEYYQWERMKEHERVMKAAQKDSYGVGNSQAGSDRWYPKGSLVLDMLRDVMGEEDFKKSITLYLQQNGNTEVWTADLQKTIYKATGQSLDWFFDQWIERGGEPDYEVTYEEHDDRLLINIKQLQEINALRPVFVMPVNYEIHFTDGSVVRKQLWNREAFQQISITKTARQQLSYFLFDPGNRVLKKTHFQRPEGFLFHQLAKAMQMTDRLEALTALENVTIDTKREALLQAFARENFHLIKAEVLRQLANDSTAEALELFSLSLADAHPLTRRAALSLLQKHHQLLLPQVVACLDDTSYSNIVSALHCLSKLDPEHLEQHLEQCKNETGYPGKLVRIAWLQLAIGQGKTEYRKELVSYSGTGYEFMTRINAIKSLVRLKLFDESIAANMVEAALHWNTKLSPVALEALVFFNRQSEYKPLLKKAMDSNTSDEKLKQLLKNKVEIE